MGQGCPPSYQAEQTLTNRSPRVVPSLLSCIAAAARSTCAHCLPRSPGCKSATKNLAKERRLFQERDSREATFLFQARKNLVFHECSQALQKLHARAACAPKLVGVSTKNRTTTPQVPRWNYRTCVPTRFGLLVSPANYTTTLSIKCSMDAVFRPLGRFVGLTCTQDLHCAGGSPRASPDIPPPSLYPAFCALTPRRTRRLLNCK